MKTLNFSVSICGDVYHGQFVTDVKMKLSESDLILIQKCQGLLMMKGNEDMKHITAKIGELVAIDDRGEEIEEVEWENTKIGRDHLWVEGYYEEYQDCTFYNTMVEL